MKFTSILLLLLIQSSPVFAKGVCNYRAYRDCYQPKVTSTPSHALIRLYCFWSGTVSEGVVDSENLQSCESKARTFGQLVKVNYFDLETHTTVKRTVFEKE